MLSIEDYLEFLLNGFLRSEPDQPSDFLATREDNQGRYPTYSVFRREVGVMIDFQFCKRVPISVLICQLLNQRAHQSSRATPFGPEIDHYRLIGLQQERIKILALYMKRRCHVKPPSE